jgi:cell division septal protein FtsQ
MVCVIKMGEQDKKLGLFERARNKVAEINEKYRTPKIRMSRGVKIALLILRLYLLFLVVILTYKFITSLTQVTA